MGTNPFAVRIVRNYFAGQVSAEDAGTKLVDIMTNPHDPANRLKRPAKRKCSVCGGQYKSAVSLLADRGVCSDECYEHLLNWPKFDPDNPEESFRRHQEYLESLPRK